MTVFEFNRQVRLGDAGMQAVSRYLALHGYTVQDVSGDRFYQRQDIDLIVWKRPSEKSTVEVKTDTHDTGNIFLELQYSDGRPGCVFQSRAQVWAYWVVPTDTLLLIDHARLIMWLTNHGSEYARKKVRSRRKHGAQWSILGVAVPVEHLITAGVAHGLNMEGGRGVGGTQAA